MKTLPILLCGMFDACGNHRKVFVWPQYNCNGFSDHSAFDVIDTKLYWHIDSNRTIWYRSTFSVMCQFSVSLLQECYEKFMQRNEMGVQFPFKWNTIDHSIYHALLWNSFVFVLFINLIKYFSMLFVLLLLLYFFLQSFVTNVPLGPQIYCSCFCFWFFVFVFYCVCFVVLMNDILHDNNADGWFSKERFMV